MNASEPEEITPSEQDIPGVCPRCNGQKVIRVLGAGGDYENWACPVCRPKDYEEDLRGCYGRDGYDGDNAD